MTKMLKKILIQLIITCFFIQNAGVGYALRPASILSKTDKEKIAEAVHVLTRTLSDKDYAVNVFDDRFKKTRDKNIIIICGNDNLDTVTAAARLYKEGIVGYIFTTGGQARLTIPLIENIVKKYGSVRISKREEINESNIANILPQLIDLYERGRLKERVSYSESEFIRNLLINHYNIPAKHVLYESSSTNTPQNFQYAKNIILRLKPKGRLPIENVFYIQTPLQQLRTYFTFNKIFREELQTGKIKGISYTITYKEPKTIDEGLVKILLSEIWRIILYTRKGDLANIEIDSNAKPIVKSPVDSLSREAWMAASVLSNYVTKNREIKTFLDKLSKASGLNLDFEIELQKIIRDESNILKKIDLSA